MAEKPVPRIIRNGSIALAFGATASACQHSAPPAVQAVAKPAATAVSEAATARPVTADSISPATRALLQQYDLAPLWRGYEREDHARHPMEGFYGDKPYRISFYFNQVTRDPIQPNLFHVTGVNRYKKVITPFTGTITVQAVRPFTKEMFADLDSADTAYTAAGIFELREDPNTKGAGNYTGQAFLDFYVNPQGQIGFAGGMLMDTNQNPTKGCGLLFSGIQVSNATGRRQPVAFANSYVAVVPQTLNKLGLGDRSEEINPNLARLGWNEAWENDEWWAKSPKPKLSL